MTGLSLVFRKAVHRLRRTGPGFTPASGTGRPFPAGQRAARNRPICVACLLAVLATGCAARSPGDQQAAAVPTAGAASASAASPPDAASPLAPAAANAVPVPPAQAPNPATAPPQAPAPAMGPTAESAAGTSPFLAPGLLPAPGSLPGANSDLRKLVRLPEGAPLYRGPGDWYGTHDFGAPAELPYGTLWNGWLGLRLDRGMGWIQAANRLEMRDQNGDGARYIIEPGRAWTMTASDGLKVDVRRKTTGLIQIDVLGAPEAPGPPAYSGSAVELKFPTYRPARARIDAGEDGLRTITVSPSGITIDFEVLPGTTVVANSPGRFSLELRPRVDDIQMRQEGDSIVLAFASQGYLPPIAQRNGQLLTLKLQGAQLGPSLREGPLAVPEALRPFLADTPQVRATADGVVLQVRTERPHRVRLRNSGGPVRLELLLLKPGLAGKRIAIDPGHGGADTGTATPWGEPEKTLNMAVSRALERRLIAAGAAVLMTRTADTDVQVPDAMRREGWAPVSPVRELSTRSAISIWWDADVLLSVHHNGGGPASNGTEVYWYTNLNGDRSVLLAGLTQDALVRALDTVDRGVIRRPFGMVRAPNAPAALVEVGFLTNDAEARYMSAPETQERTAAAIVRALESFFAPIR